MQAWLADELGDEAETARTFVRAAKVRVGRVAGRNRAQRGAGERLYWIGAHGGGRGRRAGGDMGDRESRLGGARRSRNLRRVVGVRSALGIGPFTAAWVNRSCESEHRATVFSLHERGSSFGQAAFGPAIGLFAGASGLRTALLASAALLLPVQALYLAARDG